MSEHMGRATFVRSGVRTVGTAGLRGLAARPPTEDAMFDQDWINDSAEPDRRRGWKRRLAAARLAGARAMQEAAKQACEEVRDKNDAGDDDPLVFAASGACFLNICALVPEDVVKEADRG